MTKSKAVRIAQPLTDKEERFCQLFVLQNMGISNAFVSAGLYPNRKRGANQEQIIKELAYKLLKRYEIHERLVELRALAALTPSQANEVMDLLEKRRQLAKIARAEMREPVRASEMISAIAEDNKITGDYAPEKHLMAGKIILEIVEDGNDDRGQTKISSPPAADGSTPEPG